MSSTLCAVCEQRPTPDGYACTGCAQRASGHLSAIVELAPDARLVAAGLVRRGGGGSGGKPGSRPPLNDGATDALDAVTNALTTIARDVAETRGAAYGAMAGTDPLIAAARWLGSQLEWMRHAVDEQGAPWAVEAFAEIAECAGRMRSLVNGPSEREFLGICGATVTWDQDGNEVPRDTPCEGAVRTHRGGREGSCGACRAKWDAGPRREQLTEEARNRAHRAADIADAYRINVKTIRTWAARGQVKSYWRTEAGIVADWAEPPEGEKRERLHYVGEVLDLAAASAARREEQRSKRERRAATVAEDERLSA